MSICRCKEYSNRYNISNNIEDDYMDNNTLSMKDMCKCKLNNEESVFPDDPVLGQSYVPIQKMNKTFIPEIGLKMGTLFPELVNPYSPYQSLEEIAFIKEMNRVKEGCNKC